MENGKSNLRCYYAHSKMIYDTDQEQKEIDAIKKFYNNVICPNRDIGNCSKGMEAYINLINWAEVVVASEYDAHVGCGVYTEIKHALDQDLPVMCLRNGDLHNVVAVKMDNPLDLKVGYAKLVFEE